MPTYPRQDYPSSARLDATSVNTDAGVVLRTGMLVCDESSSARAKVTGSVPTGEENGLVVRPVPSADYVQIARGAIAGAQRMAGLGEADITGSQNGWDVWQGPTQVQPLPASSGIQLSFVSTSAQDSAGGTGIRQVRIYCLDANGAELVEDVTLNGLTPVTTVATNIRFVQCMQGIAWGSGGVAAGTIDATNGGTVYKRIAASGNRCLDTARMVPAGKQALIVGWRAGSVGNSRTAIRLRVQMLADGTWSQGFQFQDTMEARDGSGPFVEFDVPLLVPALAVIKCSAWTSASASVTASWFGWMENA